MDEKNQAAAPAQAPAATDTLPNVPETWPGAFGAYKYSKQAVRRNVVTLILLWLLVAAVGIVLDSAFKNVGSLLSFIVNALGTAALSIALITSVRGQQISVGDAISKAVPYWFKMILLMILIFLSIIGSLLLLIIPVFFVLPRLALAYYFLVDKDMGVVEAYKASWNATKGNAGKVWGIIGATIAMALLMITIIGIPFSIYFLIMYSAAYAVLYEFLGKSNPQTPAV